MSLTFGSLFAGIGGGCLGFRNAGFRVAWQVEIDGFCRKILDKHFSESRKHDDVRTFPPSDAADWRVDCILGGDPCQGNSNAGSVYKTQHEDYGSELVRIVERIRPRIVVRENPYPSRPDALWPWWRMRNELERLGYAVLPFRLRSCCLGADHRRDRVWLLAEMPDANGGAIRMQGRGAHAATSAGVQGTDGQRQRLRIDADAVDCGQDAANANGKRLEGIDWKGIDWKGIDWKGIEAGHAGGIGGNREPGERIDGLPAPRVCRSRNEVPNLMDRLRALGNAIDPVASEWIGRRILEAAQ